MKIWAHFKERYLTAGTIGLTERRVELFAIALVVILLLRVILSGISLALLSAPDTVRPSLGGVDISQLDSRERVSESQREEIIARPLFWSSRRPETEATLASGSKAAADRGRLEGVSVLGVFGSGGTAGVIALVEKRQQRILLGETLQGWELAAVHPDRVELTRGAEQKTLLLEMNADTGAQSDSLREPRSPAALRGREARPNGNKNRAQTRNNDKSGESSAAKLGWGS